MILLSDYTIYLTIKLIKVMYLSNLNIQKKKGDIFKIFETKIDILR